RLKAADVPSRRSMTALGQEGMVEVGRKGNTMIPDDSSTPAEVSVTALDRIDQACDEYEGAWRGRQNPAIESFLAGWMDLDRVALLRELIALDVALRHERGEQPTRADYLDRFPAERGWIAEFFESRLNRAGRRSPTRGRSRTVSRNLLLGLLAYQNQF